LSCSPGVCSGHGDCDDSGAMIACNCHTGYSGNQCQTCDEGYVLQPEGDCEKAAGCQPDTCNNNGVCSEDHGVESCECYQGYAGTYCNKCALGYVDVGDNFAICVAQATCTIDSCSRHGTCDDSQGLVMCSCDLGYSGASCDQCGEGFHRTDDQSCVVDHVCQPDTCNDHGDCVDSNGEISCDCLTGYAGLNCERCAAGYRADGSGNCLPDEYCGQNTCNGHGSCDDSDGIITCSCEPEYKGDHCDECKAGYQDNDYNGSCLPACDRAAPQCGQHGQCNDSSGAAICDCEPGYAGDDCQNCAIAYQDNDKNGSCLPNCLNADLECGAHGDCEDDSGLALCKCYQGYAGNSCQYCASGYQDNDDNGSCLENCPLADLDCGQHGECNDSSGLAVCDCDLGYFGYECQNCAAGFHPEGDLCLPDSAWCGNGQVEGYEECDLQNDSACPGKCSAQCACPSAAARDRLEIHMIDVGQGDAILIISPDGFVMLVDAGNDWDDAAILEYLDNLGISSLDYTLVSHMHADHLGGMDGVLEDMPAVACFDSGGSYSTWEYDQYNAEAGARRTMLEVGDTIDLGPATQANVLHSFFSDEINENLNSVVVRITYGSTSVLLGGDCEAGCEASFDPGQIDVYKVHHHGSNDSSSNSLLDQMDAKLALIPVGTDNPYGHPNWNTLQGLLDHDVDVHRTDLEGDLEVHCNGSSCSLQD